MNRLIPDSECKQGKCSATTTGCWGKCAMSAQESVVFSGKVHTTDRAKEIAPIQAIMLTRNTVGLCEVSIKVDGRWVTVIQDSGEIIQNTIHPVGIECCVNASTTAPAQEAAPMSEREILKLWREVYDNSGDYLDGALVEFVRRILAANNGEQA